MQKVAVLESLYILGIVLGEGKYAVLPWWNFLLGLLVGAAKVPVLMMDLPAWLCQNNTSADNLFCINVGRDRVPCLLWTELVFYWLTSINNYTNVCAPDAHVCYFSFIIGALVLNSREHRFRDVIEARRRYTRPKNKFGNSKEWPFLVRNLIASNFNRNMTEYICLC